MSDLAIPKGNDMQEKGDGLVCAYHIDGAGKAHKLDMKEVNKINKKPEGEGWYWVHMDIGETTNKWLHNYTGMLQSVGEALGSQRTRPRSYVFERGVLLIMRGINLNKGEKSQDMLSVRIWMNDKIVITTRHEKLMAVEEIKQEIANGDIPQNPIRLVIRLANGLIERITDKLEELDDELTLLEDEPENIPMHEFQDKIQDIRSQAITLLRHISPQETALTQLIQRDVPYFDREETGQFRIMSNQIAGNIGELVAIRDRAEAVQAAITARQTEQLNKTMYLLAIISAFFLPMTLFTGLLGINVGGMPGEGWAPAFWIVLAIMGAMGYGTWWLMKKLDFI